MKVHLQNTHPLVHKLAVKPVRIAMGGRAADVNVVVNQLCNSKERRGSQYIRTPLDDVAIGHPVYTVEESTISFFVPDKLRVKIPNTLLSVTRVHIVVPLVRRSPGVYYVSLGSFHNLSARLRMKCGCYF